MATKPLVFVPGKQGSLHFAFDGGFRTFNGEKYLEGADKYLRGFRGSDVVFLSVMGGPAQTLCIRVRDEYGLEVQRIPWFRLEELIRLTRKATPGDTATAIVLAWETQRRTFYEMQPLQRDILLIQRLARRRKAVQDVIRKPAQVQFLAGLRELAYLLPGRAQFIIEGIEAATKANFRGKKLRELQESLVFLQEVLRQEADPTLLEYLEILLESISDYYANPRVIVGALADEKILEKQIAALLKRIEVWTWFKPRDGSLLPTTNGLGPNLGGMTISEIGDIRRFPDRAALRGYARQHLVNLGEKPAFPNRVHGQPSPWNRYLEWALWQWSNKIYMYDGVWRTVFRNNLVRQLRTHTEVVPREVTTAKGERKTVYDFSLTHLKSRAARKTAHPFCDWVFDVMQAQDQGHDPEVWYERHTARYLIKTPQEMVRWGTWSGFFAEHETRLTDTEMEYLKGEIARRRKSEPKEEEGEEKDFLE